jgi:DNA-binding NarL/FixJ family response regulator
LSSAVPVRVVLADSQAIFRVGISRVLAAEPGIIVQGQAENLGELLSLLATAPADVLLLEPALSPTPAEAISEILKRFPRLFIVLLLNVVPPELETVEYLRRGVQGMVTRAVAPELLVKCLRKVFEGEYWIGRNAVAWVLKAFRAQAVQLRSTDPRQRLSERELLIIAGVTRGLRNKDIAREIGTSEQVIKNYLRKIYEKLGINDRLELALYTVHKRLLEAFPAAQEGVPSAAAEEGHDDAPASSRAGRSPLRRPLPPQS